MSTVLKWQYINIHEEGIKPKLLSFEGDMKQI